MNELVKIASVENPIVTSITAETFEDKKRFYNAVNAPTGDVQDIVNTEVYLTDYHMTAEEKLDDDGVFFTAVKTTIILDDGRSYKTTYKSFAKSLVQLMNIFGTPESWTDHKLKVKIKTVNYSGGLHSGLDIEVI